LAVLDCLDDPPGAVADDFPTGLGPGNGGENQGTGEVKEKCLHEVLAIQAV
jgi:hypothetical protein